MDYTTVYNPTCTTVFFKTNKGEYTVKLGELLQYEFKKRQYLYGVFLGKIIKKE